MPRRFFTSAFTAACLLLATRTASAQVKVSRQPSATDPSTIAPRELEAVAARVSSLCVEPPRVEIRVGDTLSLESVVVIVYDSLGKTIGRLRAFDSALLSRAHLTPTADATRRYVATSAGPAEMVLTFPKRRWAGRNDPPASAHLYIQIVPE